ncbi:DUF397 domain-containing protein [Streptomyces sp. NPDC059578]|uniref:DUF397 domain-containing protein n=1 Tax=unclassified Streptomyces TaxID=2593676 RepID=UPI00364BD7C6
MSRKSTYGATSELVWFKSSHSDSSNGSECVEVAVAPGSVLVRDSKNVGGGHLGFDSEAWAHFVTHTAAS